MPAGKHTPVFLPDTRFARTSGDRARAAVERALGMLPPNDPVLQQRSAPLAIDEIITEPVKQLITRLYEIAEGQRAVRKGRKKRTLVGLAAPQIGEAKRIILVDTKVKPSRRYFHKLECFINPEIVWRSRETEEGREGCFSTGPVCGLVRRPIAVKVRALTPEGKQTERIFEGFTARIMQHEIDHLDGIRFPDRITSDRKRHWVHAEELDDYPKRVTHWPRLCTLARWEKIKS
jgi:peptide deformylase